MVNLNCFKFFTKTHPILHTSYIKHFAYFLFYTQTKHIHYVQKTDTSGFKEIPNNTNMLNTSHNKDCTPHNLEILKQATLSIRIDYILKPNYEYTT